LKKKIVFLALVFMTVHFMHAEGTTLYIGSTSTKAQLAGITFGGDIWDFLQIQVDFMKYIKEDPSLHVDDPAVNRGDFLGASLNVVLKMPIHLIPYLDQFDYIQPYILAGRGYGVESLVTDYFNNPNEGDQKTGVFNKIRGFNSFGVGVVVMLAPKFGLKLDYRSVNIAEHAGMGIAAGQAGQARSFHRISFGVCFGGYKTESPKGAK